MTSTKRKLNKAELQAEVASSGLGPNQVVNFRSMTDQELEDAKRLSNAELSRLAAFQDSKVKRDKVVEHEKRLAYFYKLQAERR